MFLVGLLFLCGWTTHHPHPAEDVPPSQPVLNVTLDLPDLAADPGATLCVPLTTTGFDQVTAFQFSIGYDASVLTLTGLNNFAAINGFGPGSFNTNNPGQITLLWTAGTVEDNNNGVTLGAGSTLFEMCFQLSQTAGASGSISVSNSPTPIEFGDVNGNVLNVSPGSGSVTVNGGNTDPAGDLTFTFGGGSGICNSVVCVPVSATDFTDVISAQFTISFDPTVLSYDHVENFTLPTTDPEGSFGDGTNGQLTFSWSDNDAYTATAGQTLFEVCFNLIGGANDVSSLAITSNLTPLEIADSSGGIVQPVLTNDGQLTITSCGGGGGGGGGTGELTVSAAQVSADAGAQVCVPVTVENFSSIISLQFTMEYDPSVLQLSSIQNLNLVSLDQGDFNPDQAAGTITFSWAAESQSDLNNGVNLADGTTIFELCFNVIGSAGASSAIAFTGSVTSIEAAEPPLNPVPVSFNNGSVAVNTSGGGGGGGGNPVFDEFTLIFEDTTATSGSSVCIPITVANFEDIVSTQFSVSYNASVLQFTGFQNVLLPGFSPGQSNTVNPGQIGVLWTAGNPTDVDNGVDFADGTAIMELCFDVVGSNGQTSPLQFGNVPTSIEVAINTQMPIPVDLVNATLTVAENIPDPDPLGVSIPTYDADAGGSVCFPVQVTNFVDITDLNLSLCFDPAVLDFTQVINLNIPGVTLSDFSSTNGSVSLSYDGSAPINLIDNTTIFDVCFNVVGAPNTSSAIEICDTPVGISVTNDNGQNVPVDANDGQINVQQGCSAVTVANADVTNVMCNGEATGAIALTLAGGDANNTISWSNNQTGSSISGLPAGTYTATISNGCDNSSFSTTYTVLEPTSALQLAVNNITTADQGNNGAIDISVSGGTPGYSYSWSNNATTQDLSGLSPGTYGVTVTDTNGCTQTANFQVNGAPLTANISTSESCQNTNTGSIVVQPNGGTGTYSATFSPQAGTVSGLTLTNAPAGTYTVSVNDGTNTFSQNVTIGTFAAVSVDGVTVNDETGPQSNDNGSISLSLSGGATPYTVNWSNNATGLTITGLDAGTYSATITDGNGCETTVGPYTVNYQPTALNLTVSGTDVDCAGDANGTLIAEVSGGDPNYEYTLTDPNGDIQTFMATDQTPLTITDLPAGMYVISVIDGNDPSQGQSVSFEVTEPDPITATVAMQPETDNGNDGTITLDPTGGVAPYTYLWSNGATTQNLTGIAEGCYDVTVTDANGCEMTMTDLCVGLITVVGLEVTNALCESALNGAIQLTVAGGTDLTFQWFNQDDELVGTQQNLSGVPAGTYRVLITDASDQSFFSQEVVIIIENDIVIEAVANTDFNGFAVSCGDENNGSIQVEAVGGTGAFAYLWSTGDTTKRVDNLPAGTYSVTVSNLLGGPNDPCFFVDEITISAPTVLTVEIGTFDTSCFGDEDGELTANVTGGVAPYTFAWNDGQTTATATDLTAGDYSLTVTDANGCELVVSAAVGGAPELTVNVLTTADVDGTGGAIDVRIDGGTAPYTLTYSEGIPGTDINVVGIAPGDYTLTVSDANGCETTVAFVITNETDCLATRLVITPDGDGRNETFVINCSGQYANNRLEIYNRFGQLVYEQTDYDDLWNGVTTRGSLVDDGAYFFVFEYDALSGAREQLKGHITVIRE